MTKEEAKDFAKVLNAYSEGKQIQLKEDSNWENLSGEVHFGSNFKNYRVKPDPRWRPYDSIEEFSEALKKHGNYLTSKLRLTSVLPVRMVDNTVYMYWTDVLLGYSFKDLFRAWLHQDGTPCGVLIED